LVVLPRPPTSTLFPYTTLFRSGEEQRRTMVIIEEAHEFLSDTRIKQMPILFQQVARIARRGRKRWLGLTFVTQLPQHLPDEVLGDRKSTRLNSSHLVISYAVFC